MAIFSDKFMAAFVNDALRASVETDARLREVQMAALTANGLGLTRRKRTPQRGSAAECRLAGRRSCDHSLVRYR